MMPKLFARLAAALFIALIARKAWADVRIEAACQVTSSSSQCTFTNIGSDQGKGCAVVHVTNRGTGLSTHSATICSGDLAAHSTATFPAIFIGEQPRAICGIGMYACGVEVKMSDIQETGFSAYTVWFVVAFLVISSMWVYVDARLIGARKGLLGGFFDMGPAGWFVACMLFWVIGFPFYLYSREKIKKAARSGAK